MSAITSTDHVHDNQTLTDDDVNQAPDNGNNNGHLVNEKNNKVTISFHHHVIQRCLNQRPHCDVGNFDMKVDNNFMTRTETEVGDNEWNINLLAPGETNNHDTEMDVPFEYRANHSSNAKNGQQSDSLEKAIHNSSSFADDVNVVQRQCKTHDKNHQTHADVSVDGGNIDLEAQSDFNGRELECDNNLLTHSDVNDVDKSEDNTDGLKHIIKCAFAHFKPSSKEEDEYMLSNSQQTVASNDKLHLNENQIQNDVHSEKPSAKHSLSFHEPSRKQRFEQFQQVPKCLNNSERRSDTSKTSHVENHGLVPKQLENSDHTVLSCGLKAIPTIVNPQRAIYNKHLSIRNVRGLMEPVNNPRVSTIIKDDEDSYNFSHEQRGYMVIVVNDRFARQNHRDGAHWDLLKMKEIARKLGFRILNSGNERNLDKSTLMRELERAQNLDHSNCDTFAFAISTHGLEKENARANGKQLHALVCADDQLLFTSTIFEMFNDENCPTLKNKPKLFFIQACRGEHQDAGSEVYVVKNSQHIDKYSRRLIRTGISEDPDYSRTDEKDAHGSQDSGTAVPVVQLTSVNNPYTGYLPEAQRNIPNNAENYNLNVMCTVSSPSSPKPQAAFVRPFVEGTPSLLCDNDMVVLYAIPPGMFAWRNTNDGSWMIDFLHQVLMAYDMQKPKSFLALLTKVSAMMSKRTTNVPAIPKLHAQTAVSVVEHKTTKDIIFYQKTQLSNWVRNTKA